ncbi:hypothetical protein A3780_20435 [Kosakonia radicincitans]|uniref:autotransporter domain-containing protein n=1 Tax=Kosakonia radicincitans TaxID=283686 RepID=UPI0009099EBB|nr:autotransporter domain-containing protein [Kosakonia radicincitans]APG19814.1 hypothetical protein A3780_20435 [Kosakonia radicincitans]
MYIKCPLCLIFFCIALNVQANTFDSITVFGDSLSDTGNAGRYTWDGQSAQFYDEQLAAHYGLTLSPFVSGGSNYATGGAMAISTGNSLNTTAIQVQQYLLSRSNQADNAGLFIHYIGGNDIIAASQQPNEATNIVTMSSSAAASQVKSLLQAGAGLIVVPSVPDISFAPLAIQQIITTILPSAQQAAVVAAMTSLSSASTPDESSRLNAIHQAFYEAASVATSVPAQQQVLVNKMGSMYEAYTNQLSSLSALYRDNEIQILAGGGGNIAYADVNGLFREMLVSPNEFGLTNTAGSACPVGISAANCTSTMQGFNKSQHFLFADGLHPSPSVQSIMGDYMASILDAPVQVSALARVPENMIMDSRTLVDERYRQLRISDSPVGENTISGGISGSLNPRKSGSLLLSVDRQLSEEWNVGGLVALSPAQKRGEDDFYYSFRGRQAGVYSQLGYGPFWLTGDAILLYAGLDDIRRTISLGPLTRQETGHTDSRLTGLRISTGFDLPVTEWLRTGPRVQYYRDDVRVGGYEESGDSSTSMRFDSQHAVLEGMAAGWMAGASIDGLDMELEARYRHETGDTVPNVRGGLKSSSLEFSRNVPALDRNKGDIRFSTSTSLTTKIQATGSLTYIATGSDSGEMQIFTGISAHF